jgi:hypothetical protein
MTIVFCHFKIKWKHPKKRNKGDLDTENPIHAIILRTFQSYVNFVWDCFIRFLELKIILKIIYLPETQIILKITKNSTSGTRAHNFKICKSKNNIFSYWLLNSNNISYDVSDLFHYQVWFIQWKKLN